MAATSILYVAVAVHSRPAKALVEKLQAADNPSMGIEGIREILALVNAGNEPARVYAAVDDGAGTAGTCTIACTQANATVGETVTVCGVTFTIAAAETSNPRDGIVTAGASDTTFGASLAAKINAHPLLKDMVTAVNAAGTVTLTFKDKGLFANLAVLSETGDAFVVAQPSNGAEGAVASGGSLRVFAKGI